jgi:hypothetical protein
MGHFLFHTYVTLVHRIEYLGVLHPVCTYMVCTSYINTTPRRGLEVAQTKGLQLSTYVYNSYVCIFEAMRTWKDIDINIHMSMYILIPTDIQMFK